MKIVSEQAKIFGAGASIIGFAQIDLMDEENNRLLYVSCCDAEGMLLYVTTYDCYKEMASNDSTEAPEDGVVESFMLEDADDKSYKNSKYKKAYKIVLDMYYKLLTEV